MKNRALLLAAVLLLVAGSLSAATLFRIVVDGQGEIVTSTAPVRAGSVVLVRLSNGTMTAIPSNLVVSVSTAKKAGAFGTPVVAAARLVNSVNAGKSVDLVGSLQSRKLSGALAGRTAASAMASAKAASRLPGTLAAAGRSVDTSGQTVTTTATTSLVPGQTIFVGQTGGVTTTAVVSRGVGTAAATAADTIVVTPRSGAGTALAFSANPLAASIERQVFAGDLPRDSARTGLTVGTNTAINSDFVIGPNGFPIPVTVAPQAGTLAIGPNGFPLLTDTGPAGGIQPINPNGFPATTVAPFTQTGLTRAGTSRETTVPATITTGSAAGIATPATAAATTTSAGTSGLGGPPSAAPAPSGLSGSPR